MYGTTLEYVTAMKHDAARSSFWKSDVRKNRFHGYCRTVCYHRAFAVGFGAICCLCLFSNNHSTV